MFRRLGQHNQSAHYRCQSPSQSLVSECSLPISATPQLDDFPTFEDIENVTPPPPPKALPTIRIVEKPEIAIIEANIAKKLNTIVSLITDFASDAVKMRESPEDLLDELRTKVRPFLIALDLDMCSAESLMRYNIDRANIQENRIDWLLVYSKYQKEMRRMLSDLSESVYDDLESSLELQYRGVIGRRPSNETTESLEEMRDGMGRALSLLDTEIVPCQHA